MTKRRARTLRRVALFATDREIAEALPVEEPPAGLFRGSAVTRLALAGATVPEIATITGQSLKDVEEILDTHYLSRDISLAERAMKKMERAARQAKRERSP